MPGYLLDEDSIARLAGMLRAYEQGSLGDSGLNLQPEYGTAPIVNYVRCTSATATGGSYPGQLVTYDPATATYTDTQSVRLIDINGGTLANNTRYLARYAGLNSSGDPVYITDSSSTSGAILTIDVVTSISCVDGVITPVWTTLCIPGAYVCTTTTTTTTSTTTTTTSTTTTAEPTTTTTSTSGT
jgi:hypothetical protein